MIPDTESFSDFLLSLRRFVREVPVPAEREVAASAAIPEDIGDDGIERFNRDVRLFRIYDGTSQVQQVIIARDMLRHAEST